MWESFKVIIQHFSGTLTLILVDTLSFCVALRIFMNESLKVESNVKMMYIAVFLTIISLISTIKLMSGSKSPSLLYNYAKLEGFDDDSDLDDEESDDEFYSEDLDSDEDLSEDSVGNKVNEEKSIHVESNKDEILDINISFDDSESIKGFDSTYESSGRVTLD